MLFNSFEFIFLFLPLALLTFFQIGKQGYYQVAIAWLVILSLFFYAWWNVSYLGLLLVSIIFNYFVGLAISRRCRTVFLNQKGLLAFGVVVNVGLLGYFKYTDFFVATSNNLFDTSFNLQTIILPLAISFYTFNQLAYLVDAYRGKAKEYNFLNYCLFITFFPHLIAGPIVHHEEMIPQFEQESIYRFNPENLAVGLAIFSIGLLKKLIIADQVAIYANSAFSAAARGISLTFLEAWGGAIQYSFQLYFDFSGYSDMAIGLALMFNIKFPINFESPYKALNIIDFWRRWHITLSRFLRDYIYIPLGGNRRGEFRRYLNLMITMLLGGLWHGAGWTFVLWGGLHGIYLVINHQWDAFRHALGHDNSTSGWSKGLSCLVTFLAVVVAWVFFRAENMDTALRMLAAMAGTNGVSFESFVGIGKGMLVLLLIIVWFTPNTQQWMAQYNPSLEQRVTKSSTSNNSLWKKLQWQPNVACGILVGVSIFISLQTLLAAPASEFLYFNF